MSAIILESFAHKIVFATAPIAPAEEGSVKVKKDKSNDWFGWIHAKTQQLTWAN